MSGLTTLQANTVHLITSLHGIDEMKLENEQNFLCIISKTPFFSYFSKLFVLELRHLKKSI